jgi:hypothetical protein
MYLRSFDYQLYCDSQTLTQIINYDLASRVFFEYTAEDFIKSRLMQRFDFTKPYGEFTDTSTYSNTTIYKANNRVYLDADAYSATSTYALGVQVLQAGNVYICTTAILVAEAFTIGHWTLLGSQYAMFYITPPETPWDFNKQYYAGDEIYYKDKTYTCVLQNKNIAPDARDFNLDKGKMYWGDGTAYTVAAGTYPTDTTKWTEGDNRNNYLVKGYISCVVDAMFIKVAPKNIPQVRIDQYKEFVMWLDMAAKGEVTADLPLIITEQGNRIRWNSIPKTDMTY